MISKQTNIFLESDHLELISPATIPAAPCVLRVAAFWLLGSLLVFTAAATGYAQNGGPPGGQVLALAIGPATSGTLYAGTAIGGVFKSTSGGISWNPLNAGLTNFSVLALAIDPLVPATFIRWYNLGHVQKYRRRN